MAAVFGAQQYYHSYCDIPAQRVRRRYKKPWRRKWRKWKARRRPGGEQRNAAGDFFEDAAAVSQLGAKAEARRRRTIFPPNENRDQPQACYMCIWSVKGKKTQTLPRLRQERHHSLARKSKATGRQGHGFGSNEELIKT